MKNCLDREVNLRIASALADTADQRTRFLSAMASGFVPSSNVRALADVNPSSCLIGSFVQPIGPDVAGHDAAGRPGVFTALAEAAETLRHGGAVGYDFSAMAPSGSSSSDGGSSVKGPVNFLNLFVQLGLLMSSQERSPISQSAVLRVDHPDIFDFINTTVESSEKSKFKLYVGITDSFMEALSNGTQFALSHEYPPSISTQDSEGSRHAKYLYGDCSAQDLWGKIMVLIAAGSSLGLIFVDQVVKENNLKYVEEISAACSGGGVPLPPYGACAQGSIDLTKFIRNPYTAAAEFDEKAFQTTVSAAVEMLNQVLDKTSWPLTSQGSEALSKRRIGLGPSRVAEALEMLGYIYGSQGSKDALGKIMCSLRDSAYSASVDLAVINGPFPLFDAQSFLEPGSFASGLPQSIQDMISAVGIRNSHLLTGALIPKEEKLSELGKITGADVLLDNQIDLITTSSSFVDSASLNRIYLPTGIDQDDLEATCYKLWRSNVKGLDEVIFV